MVSRSGVLHAYDKTKFDGPPLCKREMIDYNETRPMDHNFKDKRGACKNCIKALLKWGRP